MKISEYIVHLQALQAINGDLDVMAPNFGSSVLGACRNASKPGLATLAVLGKRESVLRYHMDCNGKDTDANRGKLVVRT